MAAQPPSALTSRWAALAPGARQPAPVHCGTCISRFFSRFGPMASGSNRGSWRGSRGTGRSFQRPGRGSIRRGGRDRATLVTAAGLIARNDGTARASARQESAMAQPEDGRPAQPTPPAEGRRLFASWADVVQFGRTAVRRFLADLCLERAAALSYTSVVSLVPAAAVSLAFLSALPQTGALRADVENLLMEYLLPNAGATAVDAFRTFVGKAAGLSVLGFVGLAVTAVMLLVTVNTAFDAIWRVQRPRPLAVRLLAYWALLTLGPLLMGLSLS